MLVPKVTAIPAFIKRILTKLDTCLIGKSPLQIYFQYYFSSIEKGLNGFSGLISHTKGLPSHVHLKHFFV